MTSDMSQPIDYNGFIFPSDRLVDSTMSCTSTYSGITYRLVGKIGLGSLATRRMGEWGMGMGHKTVINAHYSH